MPCLDPRLSLEIWVKKKDIFSPLSNLTHYERLTGKPRIVFQAFSMQRYINERVDNCCHDLVLIGYDNQFRVSATCEVVCGSQWLSLTTASAAMAMVRPAWFEPCQWRAPRHWYIRPTHPRQSRQHNGLQCSLWAWRACLTRGMKNQNPDCHPPGLLYHDLEPNQFRLLFILPGKEDDILEFNLTWLHKLKPPDPLYIPISYRWKANQPLVPVKVSGHAAEIPQDLNHLMRKLRHPDGDMCKTI
jgi:hypothetical protein